jgi:hypothetical protein
MSDMSGGMRSIDEIANELYALPPAEFTAARDSAVASARESGDRARAKELAAFKRPTVGAHLVNLLALRRPDVVAGLIDLGEQIRAAQGAVSAAQLRDLSSQRRTAIGAALRACRSLAAESGSEEPSAQQLGEVEATLAAAMADNTAADQVRAGRITKALSYAGFGTGFGATTSGAAKSGAAKSGAAAPARAPAAPARPPDVSPVDATEHDRRRERAAWERLARAQADLGVAQEKERGANEELDRLADEITRLRTALDEASKRARAARTARQAAERALALARREAPASTEEGGRAGH